MWMKTGCYLGSRFTMKFKIFDFPKNHDWMWWQEAVVAPTSSFQWSEEERNIIWGLNFGIVVLIRASATAHRIHTLLYHNWYICLMCKIEIFITVTKASRTPFFEKWSVTTYLPHCTVISQWLCSSFFQYLRFGATSCSHPQECVLCTQFKNGAMSFSWKCVILT